MDILVSFFEHGSLIMYFLLICLGAALLIIAERVYYLFVICQLKADMFMDKIYKYINTGNYIDALSYSANYSSPLANIVKSALERHDGEFREIQNAVDEGFLENFPKINKGLSVLPNLAQIATLMGFLGTLIGIISAFTPGGNTASLQIESFPIGFATALNTTVFGIIVAIICLAAYTAFKYKSDRLIEEIDENSVKLVNYIIQRRGK